MLRCTSVTDIAPIEEAKARRIAQLLKVFGDPGRIQILSVLVDNEVCVSHIAQAIGKSVSAVSHQLRILRSHNIVRYIRDGKNTYYTLDDKHVEDVLKSGMEHIEHSNQA